MVYVSNAHVLGDFMSSLPTDIKAIFLDLDGTMYMGSNLIEGAHDFLERCKQHGVATFFLSNNSSRSVDQYRAKLEGFGIEATESQILLSTHDLIAWLQQKNITETWAVATKGMCAMLEAVGITTRSINPQYVVVGYDTELTYEKISTASIHLHAGVPLVASHPDMVCPSPQGGLPDTGSYLVMFEATTGVKPTHVSGKPNPGMILHKIEALGLEPHQCAMVGDRLYTDIAMANRSGVHSVLVLTGEATMEDVASLDEGSEFMPSIILDSVADLLR